MNDNPKISVIMSVYNGEDYLESGLLSVLNQSFFEFEFIICDDGSTDKTYELLLEYQKKDDRIILIKNEKNMGLSYSLNRCIELSKANILARQDADDKSKPDRFEKQYDFVINHPEYSIIGTGWDNVFPDGHRKTILPMELPTAKKMIWSGSYMHPSWMMRKADLEKIGFYTVNSHTRRDQDYYLVMTLLSVGMALYNMQTSLYEYTVDNNTFKRTKSWKSVKNLMWIRYHSYKMNKLPFWCYLGVLKPFF